jgi:hypothetical protein
MQGGMPEHGPPAKGAVFKSPNEIAPGKHVTDPGAPAPGRTEPTSPQNRNMSLLTAPQRAGRA